jgi:hypothetical protein
MTALSDGELLSKSEQLYKEDKVIPAARLLRQVSDESKLTDLHKEILRRAGLAETLRENLTSPVTEGWTKQGESHGKRDFITYYKVEDGKLFCRIESVIEASLYVPFLCTMNETQLYEKWMPKWRFPISMGLSRSNKLKQVGRCEQVVQLTLDLPFPLHKREVVFFGFAEEDVDETLTSSAYLRSVETGFDDDLVPPVDDGVVRCDFSTDFLFCRCPPDHPALLHSRKTYPEGENLILLTVVMYSDPHIPLIPKSFQNFCTRVGIGSVWAMLLRVSEDVRDGKRPEHAEVIASKREEIYDWLDERSAIITGASEKAAATSKEQEQDSDATEAETEAK